MTVTEAGGGGDGGGAASTLAARAMAARNPQDECMASAVVSKMELCCVSCVSPHLILDSKDAGLICFLCSATQFVMAAEPD